MDVSIADNRLYLVGFWMKMGWLNYSSYELWLMVRHLQQLWIWYIPLGKFDDDLTASEPWESVVNKGNHFLLWPYFKLAKSNDLPRLMVNGE